MNSTEQQLRMVVEKHKEHLKEIDVCISMCTELGMHIAENASQNNKLSEIEAQIASYLKMEHDMQAHIAALNEIILELSRVSFIISSVVKYKVWLLFFVCLASTTLRIIMLMKTNRIRIWMLWESSTRR